jgi:hypothetical protein
MKHGKTESELTFGTSQRSSKDLNKASNCSTPLLICKIEESNRKKNLSDAQNNGENIQG